VLTIRACAVHKLTVKQKCASCKFMQNDCVECDSPDPYDQYNCFDWVGGCNCRHGNCRQIDDHTYSVIMIMGLVK